jgi:two-component system chemotaxis response regulator CheY
MAKIIVVDDSKMMREMVCFPLREAGYEVLGVEPSSLHDVLNQIASFQPDLVITDYQMPNFSGESLVRALRADSEHSALRILVLTALRDEDIIQRMSRHGVSGYLFKGKGMQELQDRVAEILQP